MSTTTTTGVGGGGGGGGGMPSNSTPTTMSTATATITTLTTTSTSTMSTTTSTTTISAAAAVPQSVPLPMSSQQLQQQQQQQQQIYQSTTLLPQAVLSTSNATPSSLSATPNAPPQLVSAAQAYYQNPQMNGGILMIMSNGPSSFIPSLRKLRHVKSIMCRNLIPRINVNADQHLPNTYYTLHAPPPNRLTKNRRFDAAGHLISTVVPASSTEQQQHNGHIPIDDEENKNNDRTPDYSDDELHFDEDDEVAAGEDADAHSADDDDDEDLPPPFYTSEVVRNSYNPLWNSFDCYSPLPNEILEHFNSFNICIWEKDHDDEPLFQAEIDLTQLEFIAQEIKQFVNLIIPPNSIIFELKDGLYVTKETKNQMSSTRSNDYKFTMSNEKRKSDTVNQEQLLKIIAKKLTYMKNVERTKQLSKEIEDKLDSNAQYTEKLGRLEKLRNRVKQLNEECCEQLLLKDKDKEAIEKTRKDLVPRATALANAGVIFYSSLQQTIESIKVLDMDRVLLNNIRATLDKKKWHLLYQITSIYPLQQGSKGLVINNLPLPHSDYNGCDEESISTALGYVCHIVHLASRYLDIPLRYPMTPMASRSFIRDEILHHSASKFPLYSRGVEKKIFDYAVFLLNKNLEQLLHSQGSSTFPLKETLHNVQTLLGMSMHYSKDVWST